MDLFFEFYNGELVIHLTKRDEEGRGFIESSIYIPLSDLKKELEKVE